MNDGIHARERMSPRIFLQLLLIVVHEFEWLILIVRFVVHVDQYLNFSRLRFVQFVDGNVEVLLSRLEVQLFENGHSE